MNEKLYVSLRLTPVRGNKLGSQLTPHLTCQTSALGSAFCTTHSEHPQSHFAMTTVAARSSFGSFASTNPNRRQFNRLKKDDKPGDVWGTLDSDLPNPLDKRFVDVKKRLVIPENYAAVQDSWDRLLVALKERAVEIEAAGPDVSPLIHLVLDNELTISECPHGQLFVNRIRRKVFQRRSRSNQIPRMLRCPWCCQSRAGVGMEDEVD